MQAHLGPGTLRWDLGFSQVLPAIIEKRTDGRIQVTPFAPDSLVKVEDMLDALGTGLYEMQTNSPGYVEGKVSIGKVESGLPYYGNPHDGFMIFNYFGLEELCRESYMPMNVYYLTYILNGGGGGVISTVPIHTIDDMQNVILRMWGGSMADLVAKVGFEVAFLPMGEIYMALTLGTVDAAMTSWPGLYGLKAHEPAKYIIQPDIVPATADHITINLDVWNGLPGDLQQNLFGAGHDYRELHFNFTLSQRVGAINAMVAEGAEINMLTEEAQRTIRDTAFTVWDDVAAVSDECAQGVQIVKDYWSWVDAGSTGIEDIVMSTVRSQP